jgi:antitoxin (DNA-binding transcriptional repressor) of toxin-antitoxin stability system
MTVGTNELRNRLSHYLRRAGSGEVIRVTNRGKIVAEIRAVETQVIDDELVTQSNGRFATFRGVRLRQGSIASRAILADRGE